MCGTNRNHPWDKRDPSLGQTGTRSVEFHSEIAIWSLGRVGVCPWTIVPKEPSEKCLCLVFIGCCAPIGDCFWAFFAKVDVFHVSLAKHLLTNSLLVFWPKNPFPQLQADLVLPALLQKLVGEFSLIIRVPAPIDQWTGSSLYSGSNSFLLTIGSFLLTLNFFSYNCLRSFLSEQLPCRSASCNESMFVCNCFGELFAYDRSFWVIIEAYFTFNLLSMGRICLCVSERLNGL